MEAACIMYYSPYIAIGEGIRRLEEAKHAEGLPVDPIDSVFDEIRKDAIRYTTIADEMFP